MVVRGGSIETHVHCALCVAVYSSVCCAVCVVQCVLVQGRNVCVKIKCL
jgi:hypothetical protein